VVVENGVSDERETFELEVRDGDPSGVRLTSQDADRFCNEPECPRHATTVLLDDLLEVVLSVLLHIISIMRHLYYKEQRSMAKSEVKSSEY